MHLPSLPGTIVSSDGFEWRPETFSNCLIELEHIRTLIPECCYYRGQRLNNRLLDSTFARKMKERRGLKNTQRYSFEQQSNTTLQHELGNDLFKALYSVPVLRPFLSKLVPSHKMKGHPPIDMIFQYHIHIQQNPKDPNLIEFTSLGTNFLDFSLNWKIGLFFSNRNRLQLDEGALFVVHQKNLGPVFHPGETPFQDIILRLKQSITQHPLQEYPGLPRLPWPTYQWNNTLDPKPKRQEAIYIAQMDFRKDLELSWKELYAQTKKQTYVKIIIPANTTHEVEEYLTGQGLTEEFLFPKTQFDEIQLS
jgi:hypothetical protein